MFLFQEDGVIRPEKKKYYIKLPVKGPRILRNSTETCYSGNIIKHSVIGFQKCFHGYYLASTYMAASAVGNAASGIPPKHIHFRDTT